jgi:phosphoglycerate dehydrogenase-like enzyme
LTRLLIYAPSHDAIAAEIAARAPGLDILAMDDAGAITLRGAPVALEQAHADIAWIDQGLFMSKATRSFLQALAASPSLTWVQSAAAGFDHPLFKSIVAKGARLSISHGQAVGIADYVVWGVLDAFQRGLDWRADQQARVWKPRAFREVNGTHWLIVGFGAIGQAVATRARAFGATVTGVRRDQTPHPLADRIASQADLPTLAPLADVVVLSLPLSAATHHLADAAFFAAMKPGSVLVNVGRGGLVDEAALLAALDAGAPAAAVLDVFQTEPLPADSAFWDHPRVRLTPHSSGVTGAQNHRNADLFLDNLERFVSGRPLLNVADPKDVLAE